MKKHLLQVSASSLRIGTQQASVFSGGGGSVVWLSMMKLLFNLFERHALGFWHAVLDVVGRKDHNDAKERKGVTPSNGRFNDGHNELHQKVEQKVELDQKGRGTTPRLQRKDLADNQPRDGTKANLVGPNVEKHAQQNDETRKGGETLGCRGVGVVRPKGNAEGQEGKDHDEASRLEQELATNPIDSTDRHGRVEDHVDGHVNARVAGQSGCLEQDGRVANDGRLSGELLENDQPQGRQKGFGLHKVVRVRLLIGRFGLLHQGNLFTELFKLFLHVRLVDKTH